MAYVTITTWEVRDGADMALVMERVRGHRLPALKELGATRVTVVQTTDRTLAAISEWPDRETRDAAARAIEAVRDKVRSEDHSVLTGEMKGEVVAAA